MPFPESVKLEAKRRSHYACVWCQRTDQLIEVHHIVAQEDTGPDTIENAAPLCPGCHTLVGPNPELRKQLKERRDWWWSHCASTRAPAADEVTAQRLDELLTSLKTIEAQGGRNETALTELKSQVLGRLQAQLTAVSSASTSNQVMLASEPFQRIVQQLTATVTFTGAGQQDGMPDPYHSYFVVSSSGLVSGPTGGVQSGAVVTIIPVSGDAAGPEQHLFAPRGTPKDGLELALQTLRSLPQNRGLKERSYLREPRGREAATRQAALRAGIIGVSPSLRLAIRNQGNAEARAIRMIADGRSFLEHDVIVARPDDLVSVLGPGAAVSYILAVAKGKPLKYRIDLFWEDDSGNPGSWRSDVTI